MNNVLMIAFHFPPDSSIGAQRTLKTAEYLPEHGWNPIVLTAKSSAYTSVEETQEIPGWLLKNVYRTSALDVHRHLSFNGKYFEWMQIIDRWSTWIPGAIIEGRKIIKNHSPDMIWSSSPTPSAHIVANFLSKHFQLPWVADFRDPFKFRQYPTRSFETWFLRYIESSIIKNCKAAIFTTDMAMKMYQLDYSSKSSGDFYTVENGFDEKNWQKLSSYTSNIDGKLFSPHKFSLFYSGILYANGRNPEPLFKAIQLLKENSSLSEQSFELIFQGSGTGDEYWSRIHELGIQDLVQFTPSVPYLDSLLCISQANALVLIQDSAFNTQVPGKLYEYMRSTKPILVISPLDSASSLSANRYPLSFIAVRAKEIAEHIGKLINNPLTEISADEVQKFSRKSNTSQISKIFDSIIQ